MAVRKIESTQTLEEFRLEFNAMTEFDFGDIGTLDPSNERITKEKAISVAEGMAHPFIVVLLLKLK